MGLAPSPGAASLNDNVILEVATAESTALNLEFNATQLRGQQLIAAVTLVKGLGGGWQETREQ